MEGSQRPTLTGAREGAPAYLGNAFLYWLLVKKTAPAGKSGRGFKTSCG